MDLDPETIDRIISAGAGLLGALIGAFAGLFGGRAQHRRERSVRPEGTNADGASLARRHLVRERCRTGCPRPHLFQRLRADPYFGLQDDHHLGRGTAGDVQGITSQCSKGVAHAYIV